MKTTTKKLSDTRVEVTVTLDAADLKIAREKAVARLAQNVKLPGFRQGKAPAALVEKQLDAQNVANETIDIAVRTTVPAAFDAAKQPPLAITNVNVTKYVPGESAEYVATADILPDVKIGDYKKLSAKMEDTTPSDADVQEIIDNIVKSYAEKTAVKRAAATGDEVIIDFTGKRENGEIFPGGSAKDHHLELGSKQFIPGFEDAIVGHSVGDKFDIKVTFPKDYPEKTLAGQPATFETLLKQVNEIKLPAVDDELAKKCKFNSLTALKEDIKNNLERQNTYRAGEKFREDLVAELVKKSKVSAPEVLINDQLRLIRDDMSRNAASHGMTFDQYLERSGMTLEDWTAEARKIAEARVKSSLVLQLLAREQNITASDEEVEAKIAELRDVYKRSKEAQQNLKRPEVRQDIRNRLVIDKTLDFIAEANAGKPAAKKSAVAKKPAGKKAEKK